MSLRTKFYRLLVALMILNSTTFVPQAHAFVWPVIDAAELTNFISRVIGGVNEIKNVKDQISQVVSVVGVIGDQASAIKNYMSDLKNTITNIKETISATVDDVKNALDEVKDAAESVEQKLNDSGKKQSENAENVKNSVNEQAVGTKPKNEDVSNTETKEEGAGTEESKKESTGETDATQSETEETIQQGKEEAIKEKNRVMKELDSTQSKIEENIGLSSSKVDDLERVAQENGLEKEMQTDLTNIRTEISNMNEKSKEVIDEIKTTYNKDFDENILGAFDNYNQSLQDYFSGKISSEELSSAGEIFQNEINNSQTEVDKGKVGEISDMAQNIANSVDELEQKLLNEISNSQDYSDEEDTISSLFHKRLPFAFDRPIEISRSLRQKESGRYAFNFHSTNNTAFFGGIYAEGTGEDKSFLLSKELKCNEMGKIKDIEKNPGGLRKCVVKAKTEKINNEDPFRDPLYSPYKVDGVYHHIIEDYKIANIVNISKIKQFSAAWGNLEENDNDKGSYKMLMKALKDVDSTRSAQAMLGLIDIEAPILWSMIRRIDALNRAKEVVTDFKLGNTLYLDGRDREYAKATSEGNGIVKNTKGKEPRSVKGKNIFPNVFLYTCGLNADDVSFAMYEKRDDKKKKEQNIADCLYKYAKAANLGIVDGKTPPAGTNVEYEKQKWRDKQTKAYNDAAMNNLTLAVVNNYKSSRDFMKKQYLDNPSKDKNIRVIQEGLQNPSVTREDLSSGALINYYSAQQILSIVDSDAAYLQAEILKDMKNMNYNYFGKSAGDDK